MILFIINHEMVMHTFIIIHYKINTLIKSSDRELLQIFLPYFL